MSCRLDTVAVFSKTGSETCRLRGKVGDWVTGSDNEGPSKGGAGGAGDMPGVSFQKDNRNRSYVSNRSVLDTSKMFSQSVFYYESSVFSLYQCRSLLIHHACLVRMANVKVQCLRELKEYIYS